MEKIDSVRERERLAKRYAYKSDLELEKVGREPEPLIGWAREALKEEADKRGIMWSEPSTAKMDAILENERLVRLRTYHDRSSALTGRSTLKKGEIETFFLKENTACPSRSKAGTAVMESR
jgi:hypothetical protein